MGKRAGLVVGLLMLSCLAAPAAASASIDILGRGITPDPAVIDGSATIEVEVKVGQAPYIVEFFCCEVTANTTAPKQQKVLDENSAETQGLSGRHKFTFNVGKGVNATARAILVRV